MKFNIDLQIKEYLDSKNIVINNLDEIFSKVTIEFGPKKDYLYANIDVNNPFNIILSEDIPNDDIYKWLNHELVHVISNNQPTVNEVNVGGIIIEDKERDIWTGKYLNEAITEYINQSIINSKYSDYYDRYIEALMYIINIIGEEVVLKAYFTNNLYLIVNALKERTNKTDKEIFDFIYSIDGLYDEDGYEIKL